MLQLSPKPEIEYSVVVPVFNGAITVEELFSRIKQVFDELQAGFEVIFVEDCGTDDSWQKIIQLKKNFPKHIVAIQLIKNYGQHNATLCGCKYAKGNIIITIDDDLQTPPEEIKKLIQCRHQTQADVVYGSYPIKKHAIIKRIGSYIVRKTFKLGAGTHNEGSSFRLISRKVIANIILHTHNFIYIDELLQWYTSKIAATPVEHQKRKKGTSGYPLFKLIFFTLDLIINYTAIPLRLMTYGGLLFAFSFFCVGLYYIYGNMVWGFQLGFTSLITAIFFTTGIILFCLGIIGEYLRRIYMGQNQKPQYAIRTLLP
ncbi:MAG: glycosyltransferase family 2 protein [Sphingobacteriales bacterium]|nr:MAG: glycosyltransferase family 2 protein [Sphingobacteriales bacterium]